VARVAPEASTDLPLHPELCVAHDGRGGGVTLDVDLRDGLSPEQIEQQLARCTNETR